VGGREGRDLNTQWGKIPLSEGEEVEEKQGNCRYGETIRDDKVAGLGGRGGD